MNLFKIIAELEKVDPEVTDRLNSRRSALAALGDISKKITLASAPAIIGAAFNKTLAQSSGSPLNDVLNYALLLERLEAAFYTQALQATSAPALVASFTANTGLRTSIEKIRDHENAHVALLTAALGPNVAAAPSGFDFSAAFGTINNFLTTAQAFEDLGVRAYKGQAGNISRTAQVAANTSVTVTNAGQSSTVNIGGSNVLQVALQIHATEARHAAYIRYIRRQTAFGGVSQYGWITNAQSNGAPTAVYAASTTASLATDFPAESNLAQGGVADLTTGLTASPAYTAAEVSEAFDEPLDSTTVRGIAGPYIRP
ncbi:ferritin-like domain-containing protein [Hymenobacter jeollabukensis]|uniref:Ferritin-like domain-containing protein n=1 Tax=Hymenobacter jeollabukensis TaxID=2025313 RepID=A0A5R8WMK6_9BACT|nr:ferritin-like domain-containing protein [Hymenobacter jeollabukensis]TLM90623.1 ferritin-like domain-containing protein [Hymenobacter jeollabukensis]